MGKKAKDHYVSRTYLKHFLNDSNKVWVYDKQGLEIRERGRAEICWSANGSSTPYLSKDRIVEEYLKIFDNSCNNAIEILSSQKIINLNEYSEAKYIISGYVAFLRFGTPAAIRAGAKSLEPTLYASLEILNRQGLLPKPPKDIEHLLNDFRKHFKFEIDEKFPQALGINAMVEACETGSLKKYVFDRQSL